MIRSTINWLRKTLDSLGFRLGFAVGISVMFACLLVTVGVLLRTAKQEHNARNTEIQTYANVLAAGVATPLFDGNINEVTRTLNAIATARGISFAAVYDTAGRRVTGIGMQAVLVDATPDTSLIGTLFGLFETQTTTAEVPIRKRGGEIGTLRLAGELPSAGAAFRQEMSNAALWATLALLIGMMVGLIFQRQIVGPLQNLTFTIAQAGKGKRLPKRVPLQGKGEIRVLAGAYNRMIKEISTRESQLQDYRLHLEDLVDVRTSELRIARDEAQAATEAKSRFLATMSHEIRTPMNGLLVMAELLERASLPPSEARHAGTIARSGRSLMRLLNDIMDFSKLEAGKIELERIPLSLDEIVGDCLGLFWEQARAKDIEIVPYIAPDVPARLTGDPTRIGQCLSNLVGNAIKFTETGHVGIDIHREEDGTVVIAVSDTGLGIPPDRLDSIFEAFSQADQSTTRRHGGTGLGLNICVQLAEAMGGTIAVTSEVGEGSCFTLRLPLEMAQARPALPALPACIAVETAQPALNATLQRALAARGIATDGTPDARLVDTATAMAPADDLPHIGLWRLDADMPDRAIEQGWLSDLLRVPVQRDELDALLTRITSATLRGRDLLRDHAGHSSTDETDALSELRVLVADDSPVNREVMSEALEVYGIVPTMAHDGVEALERLGDTAFDIAFIDGEMPRLDGFGVARRARDARIETRLVLFSAHARSTLAQDAAASGFDDTLPKPFPLDALRAMLLSIAGIEDGATPDSAPQPPKDKPAADPDAVLDQHSLDSLRSLDARRPGAMQRVVDRFAAALPAAVARLTDALQGTEREAIRLAAHALKSMCLSVGSAQLSRTVATIEHSATHDAPGKAPWEADSAILIMQIDKEADSLMDAIQSLKSEEPDSKTSNVQKNAS